MAKVEFFTRYNRPVTLISPTGDEYDKKYRIVIDERGHKVLKQDGKTNRYEKIQAHAEETSIEVILKRSELDPTVLYKRAGQYGDFTEMPQSLAEAQQMMIDLRHTFERLPVDVRKKFDNSPEAFIQKAGSKEWLDILGLNKKEEKLPEGYPVNNEKKEEKKEVKEDV